MAEGNKTYEGLAVPLFGESEIKQATAATDLLTLTGASGMSGDFLVCQSSAGSEVFVVTSAGAQTVASLTVTGIGTLDFTASDASTRGFAVAGLTSNDVVVISPREATDGAIVVDLVAAGSLHLRNVASEAANVEMNYLVISKA